MSKMVRAAAIVIGIVLFASCSSGDQKSKAEPSQGDASALTSTKPAETGAVIETMAFRLSAPSGSRNESKSSDGAVLMNAARPYGRLNVEVFTSDLDLGGVTMRKGNVVESPVIIAGAKATRIDTDLAKVIIGPSEKELLRFTIEVEKIPKPSQSLKTKVSINLLSRGDVDSAGVQRFKDEAQRILDSLVIK